jgi:hypothetical protein
MLDIPFPELAGCAADQVFAHESRFGWMSAIASCSWSRKPNAPPDW